VVPDRRYVALSQIEHWVLIHTDAVSICSGIHGVPFEPWSGVEAAPGANQSGYCTHSSVLFPMWHRPYLVLFEACSSKQEVLLVLTRTNSKNYIEWPTSLPVCFLTGPIDNHISTLHATFECHIGTGQQNLLQESPSFRMPFGTLLSLRMVLGEFKRYETLFTPTSSIPRTQPRSYGPQ
jgi:hypothetical protein